MFVSINFNLVEEDDAKISVFDRGLLYGEGVFETILAVDGKPFRLEEHVSRLLEGGKIIGIDFKTGAGSIEGEVKRLLEANSLKSAKINIILTSGIGGFAAPAKNPTLIITAVQPHEFDKSIYEDGIDVNIENVENVVNVENIKNIKNIENIERVVPSAKTINYIPSLWVYREAKKTGAFEGLFIKNGNVLEGATSNIFIVKENKVITPKDGILKGVTRGEVIKIAKNISEVEERSISIEELKGADEAFITATLKKVVPVVSVNKNPLGSGMPGPMTKKIMEEFNKLLKS